MNQIKVITMVLLFGLVAAACGSPATEVTVTMPAAGQQNRPTAVATLPSQATATPSGTWIQLSPDKAAPGTTIQIEGYLPGGPTQAEAQNDQALQNATICWQGCLDGLTEQGQPVKWSPTDAGHFETSFIVPSVPWLSAKGPQALEAGDYTIGIQCLGPDLKGCALKEAQANATFHLEGPVPKTCQASQPCASLTFTPAQASPGEKVQVLGWAPLVGMINGQAFGYSLVLEPTAPDSMPVQVGEVQQSLDGNITSSFEVPQQIPSEGKLQPGSYTIALQAIRPSATKGNQPPLVAATPFTIAGNITWDSLQLQQPLWVQPSASLMTDAVAADPANPGRIAYCAPGEIRASQDGGKNWTSIPTTPVVNLAKEAGYPLMSGDSPDNPTCISVTMDPNPRRSDSYYAVFQAMKEPYGAPPVFFMGYLTHTSGQKWLAVPVPDQLSAEDFGGFWMGTKTTVQALFAAPPTGPDQAPKVVVEETNRGGEVWKPGELTCPASGPCIRWGAAPSSIPGMGSPLPQFIYLSTDGGKTWNATGISVELRLPGPHELVAFSDKTAAVLSGMGDYPVRITQDGGQTWQVVSLPALPASNEGGPLFQGLQILPDGSLLAQTPNADWFKLPIGATSWCSLNNTNLPSSAVLLQASGDQLYWLDPASSKLESMPLSGLACSP